jgi:hypothetical protein
LRPLPWQRRWAPTPTMTSVAQREVVRKRRTKIGHRTRSSAICVTRPGIGAASARRPLRRDRGHGATAGSMSGSSLVVAAVKVRP